MAANAKTLPKVMLVDDQLPIRELLAGYLRSVGHEVVTAEDAETGLDLFARSPCDILITDRMMPAMNGEKLAVEVKRSWPGTPVIMITGAPPAYEVPTIDIILHKPFTMQALSQAISKCLNGSANGARR